MTSTGLKHESGSALYLYLSFMKGLDIAESGERFQSLLSCVVLDS